MVMPEPFFYSQSNVRRKLKVCKVQYQVVYRDTTLKGIKVNIFLVKMDSFILTYKHFYFKVNAAGSIVSFEIVTDKEETDIV